MEKLGFNKTSVPKSCVCVAACVLHAFCVRLCVFVLTFSFPYGFEVKESLNTHSNFKVDTI